jgi:uncharacterized membrane protein
MTPIHSGGLRVESLLVGFHVVSGIAIVLFGVGALMLSKGSRPHRLAGNLFFVAMAGLFGSGLVIGLLRPEVLSTGVLGMLTLYLTATGWRTARRKDGKAGTFELGAAIFAVVIAAAAFIAGWLGTTDPIGLKDKMFAPICFVIAGLALYFAALDVNVIVRGGLAGSNRLARHAWRMGFATFFGAAAGLIGQSLRFPEPVRPFLYALVLLTLVMTVFWLVRVRFTRWRMKVA